MGTRYKSDWWSIPIEQRLAVAQRQLDQANAALREAEADLIRRRLSARGWHSDETIKEMKDVYEQSASAVYARTLFEHFTARAEVDRLNRIKKSMKTVKKEDERDPRKSTGIILPQSVFPAQPPPKQPKPRVPAYPRGMGPPKKRPGKIPIGDSVAADQQTKRQALKDSTSAVKRHPKPEIIWEHILNIEAFLEVKCTEDKDYQAATKALKEGLRHLLELEIGRLRQTHASKVYSAIGRGGVRVGDYIMAGADASDNRIKEFYQAAADAIRRREEFIWKGIRGEVSKQKVLDMYERDRQQLEDLDLDWFKGRGGKWKSLP